VLSFSPSVKGASFQNAHIAERYLVRPRSLNPDASNKPEGFCWAFLQDYTVKEKHDLDKLGARSGIPHDIGAIALDGIG
jgi:hypothetical protein